MAAPSLKAASAALLTALRRAALRFPLPLACALGYTLASRDIGPFGRYPAQLPSLLLLGFFLTLAIKLWCESRSWPLIGQLLLSLGGIGLLVLRIYSLPSARNALFEGPVMFLGPAFVLLAMAAPFLRRDSKAAAFWDFNRAAWLGAAFGFVIALFLALGLSSAHYAVEELFGVRLYHDLMGTIWTVAFALVWPWYALSAIPARFTTPEGDYCPRLIGHLISYLLVPLVLVYLVILYGYMAKIAIEWQLPEGQVAGFVVGYATFGVVVHLMTYPLRQTGYVLLRLFHRFFYPALFAPVAMLALAVWLRIDTYGVTEDRYLLALFALWLAAMALLFAITKSDRLTANPLCLALLLILASFGPWGAAGLSTSSQLARLEQLLIDNGLLADGRVQPASGPVAWVDQQQISAVLDYFQSTGRLSLLEPWLEQLTIKGRKSTESIVAAMGLVHARPGQKAAEYQFQRPARLAALYEVSGFAFLTELHLRGGMKAKTLVLQGSGQDAETLEVRLERETGKLHVRQAAETLVEFDLAALAEHLRQDREEARHDELMILDQAGARLRARLIVNRLNVRQTDQGLDVTSATAILMLSKI